MERTITDSNIKGNDPVDYLCIVKVNIITKSIMNIENSFTGSQR